MFEPFSEIAFANLPVHRVDSGGMDADENIAGHRIRLRRLFILQHFRTAVLMNAHRFHRSRSPFTLDVLPFEKGSEHPGHFFMALHQPG